MASKEMEADMAMLEDRDHEKADLEDLTTEAEDKIELNPVEHITVGKVNFVNFVKTLQRSMDDHYKKCLQKFSE